MQWHLRFWDCFRCVRRGDVLPRSFGIEAPGRSIAEIPAYRVEAQLDVQRRQGDAESTGARRQQRVAGPPWSHSSEQQVLRRIHAAHRPQRRIDAARKGVQTLVATWTEALVVLLTPRFEAERPNEPINVTDALGTKHLVLRRRGEVSDQLAESAGAEMAEHVEQDETVGSLQIPECGEEIGLVLGVDVRDTVRVTNDFEASLRRR